ncbi:MAG: hypothetical protein ACK5P0_00780 [bacterium]
MMWYYVLDNLSNSNPLLWDEIMKWKAMKFLNVLQFYRIKEKELEWQRQEAQRKSMMR